MKQSELLRKQADMMDMAEKYGIEDWWILVKATPNSDKYQFALCVVEGKPVFEGDELFYKGSLVRAEGLNSFDNWKTSFVEFSNVRHTNSGIGFAGIPENELSWNPPKPRTVMVELLREDAEYASTEYGGRVGSRIADACLKALEAA